MIFFHRLASPYPGDLGCINLVVLSSPVHHCLERDRNTSALNLEQTWLGNLKHQKLVDFGGGSATSTDLAENHYISTTICCQIKYSIVEL